MTKKILSMALAIAMVMALSVTAFAQTVGTAATGTGSITITNASKGETYKVVKLFDATVNADGSAIAYTGDIPADLAAFFTKDTVGNITKAEGKTDKEITDAVEAWAKNQDAVVEATSDGSVLVFAGLKYGYYAVISSQGAVVSVDSLNPNATVVDKNSKEPTLKKEVDDADVQIGDTVTYTVTFATTNFHGAGEDAEQIKEFVLSDTLPAFLTDVKVTSITIGGAPYTTADGTVPQFVDNQIKFPWVDGNNNNIYNNGAEVVVTYTATITDKILESGVNTATLTWGFDTQKTSTVTVTTEKFTLIKVDAAGNQLENAEFELYKDVEGKKVPVSVVAVMEEPEVEGDIVPSAEGDVAYYRVANEDEEGVAIVAGNVVIKGLDKNETYYVKETVAPEGYNLLDGYTTVVINGEVKVVNQAGVELPSTGGIGTTIFYALGAVMVIGAGVLLVAKKRMSVEG